MNPILQAALGSIIRWGLAILAGYLVKAQIWSATEAETYIAAGALAGCALLWSLWQKYHSRLTFLTALAAPSGTTEAEVKEIVKEKAADAPKITLFALVVVGVLLLAGCAAVKPGNDPLVVRTEQFLNTAQGTFKLTLQVDDADRGYWRKQAPAFHAYCEDLRAPTPYQVTNTLPRYRVALLSLADVKRDYQNASASSNALFTALVTLQSLQNQAHAWLTIVTNRN